ncbi:MAG TPA: hypothetical protein VHX60_10965 [Acidobacteriaceae bacterium]|jgi:hypothetical protein|nr:hypothetical protein [Acidobacteriaceae bacterium]
MLKAMEFGLLAVTLIIVLALVLTGPPEAPPVEEHTVGAADPVEERASKAS